MCIGRGCGGIGRGSRKRFFFEKKNQKTLPMRVRAGPAVPARWAGVGVKVFWFFFSKKNRFLHPESVM
jgi:hypothetical protein